MSKPQPVAWGVGNPALASSQARSVSVFPQRKWAEASARHSGRSDDDILPLYLNPPPVLTDQERVAVMWAVASLETDPEPDAGQNKEAAEILREMLLRTAAPINRKPQ
jgi:hypothetical protein